MKIGLCYKLNIGTKSRHRPSFYNYIEYKGYIPKLGRSCKVYSLVNYNDVNEAKRACNMDTNCAYIATDDLKCTGIFQLCSRDTLSDKDNGCVLQKGKKEFWNKKKVN